MIIDYIFGTGGCGCSGVPPVPVCLVWELDPVLWETEPACWF